MLIDSEKIVKKLEGIKQVVKTSGRTAYNWGVFDSINVIKTLQQEAQAQLDYENRLRGDIE